MATLTIVTGKPDPRAAYNAAWNDLRRRFPSVSKEDKPTFRDGWNEGRAVQADIYSRLTQRELCEAEMQHLPEDDDLTDLPQCSVVPNDA